MMRGQRCQGLPMPLIPFNNRRSRPLSGDEASLFERLKKAMDMDDSSIYASLLRWCGEAKALSDGRWLHAHIVGSGHARNNTPLANLLVQMYGKCGRLEYARAMFYDICKKDTFSWNLFIAANVRNGFDKEALNLFQLMVEVEDSVKPDKYTFIPALSASASLGALADGKRVHAYIVASGVILDVVIATALVNMYGKCREPSNARVIFDRMLERDVVSWNVMLAIHAQSGHGKEALRLIPQMDLQGIRPNEVTFLAILDACASLTFLAYGRAAHGRIVASGIDSELAVKNALVTMYGKCGRVIDARIVFNSMRPRDVISWSAMITTYARNGYGKEALELFRDMDLEGVKPNRVTFLGVLEACASLVNVEMGRLIHERIVACGLEADKATKNALVHMYGRCGSTDNARQVFNEAKRQEDVVAWNAMIGAYAQNGDSKGAFELFRQMSFRGPEADKATFHGTLSACTSKAYLANGRLIHERIVHNRFTLDVTMSTALINMYGRCGCVEDARLVFDEMARKDVVSWNAMILAYTHNGKSKEALELFWQMRADGAEADRVTFLGILDACVSVKSLDIGKEIHQCICADGFVSDIAVQNALINMYGKCGSSGDAGAVFAKMAHRDAISWNAMIAAYALNDNGEAALELFERMETEGIKADRITFLSTLDACITLTSLTSGRAVHERAVASGLDSDAAVMNALVNMYGKCGSMGEAHELFDKMNNRNVITWNGMITTYTQNGLGKEAFKLFKMMLSEEGIKPNNITFLSILSACSHTGLLCEGRHLLASMSRGYNLTPSLEHYLCMIDLIGRAGYLDEARELIDNMPTKADGLAWTTLLSACQLHIDAKQGSWPTKQVCNLDPKNPSTHITSLNIDATFGRWDDVAKTINAMDENGGHPGLYCGVVGLSST